MNRSSEVYSVVNTNHVSCVLQFQFKHGDAADETPPGYNTLQIRDPTYIINGNVNHSPKAKDTLSNKSKDHEGVREATEIEEPVGERILHDVSKKHSSSYCYSGTLICIKRFYTDSVNSTMLSAVCQQ